MLLLMIKLAIAILVFATGLNASRGDLIWIWRRPKLLAKSFLAMYVVVPFVAIVMVAAFDLPRGTEIGLLFLSISAGAPLLPRKLIKFGGDPSFAFSLVVATSLLAIVTVPASLMALQPLIPAEADVQIGALASLIVKTFLLPLVVGMLVREFASDWADRYGDKLMAIAGIVLAVGALVVIVAKWKLIIAVGLPSVFAFGALTFAALFAGHWLGGPGERHRTSLAVTCATRHIGLAMLIAANIKGPAALGLVATYLFASAIVSIPYVRWRKKFVDSSELADE